MKSKQLLNRIVAVTVALLLTVTFVLQFPASAATNPYTDLTTKDGHYEAIIELTESGVVAGVTKSQYQSSKAATRGEAAQFIVNAIGVEKISNSKPTFTDVPTTNKYYADIETLVALGVVGGHVDGTFKPEGTLKRSEIAKMLTLAFELEVSSATTTKFSDVNAIKNTNEKRYIQTLIDYGITNGTSATKFSPYETLTRGQLATFLKRSMDAVSDEFMIIGVE
jgi:hypothetical protein